MGKNGYDDLGKKNGKTVKRPPRAMLGAGMARQAGEALVDHNKRTAEAYKEMFGNGGPRKPQGY